MDVYIEVMNFKLCISEDEKVLLKSVIEYKYLLHTILMKETIFNSWKLKALDDIFYKHPLKCMREEVRSSFADLTLNNIKSNL